MDAPGIILDLDDTLIDSTRAYGVALSAVGIEADSPSFRMARDLVKSRLGPGHASAHNRALYFKAMLEEAGEYTALRVLELVEAYEDALQRTIARDWAELGRSKLVERLALDFKLIILTNETLRSQLVKLTAIDPQGKLFPNVLTSEELGFEKPDPRAFLAATTRMGLVPTECWVIGDSWKDDIEPALRLGCRTIWTVEFHNTKRVDHAGVSIVSSLNDVLKCLKTRRAA